MNKNILIGFLIILFFISKEPLFSQDVESNCKKETINLELELILLQKSDIDTTTSLFGEFRKYKKIFGIFRIRIGKGVGHHEFVYKENSLIYYVNISSILKKSKTIKTVSFYYYLHNSLVKFEEREYLIKEQSDIKNRTITNVFYLENGEVIEKDLDNSHPKNMSKKNLNQILKNSSSQLKEFKYISDMQ
jgi:hypothetical protein